MQSRIMANRKKLRETITQFYLEYLQVQIILAYQFYLCLAIESLHKSFTISLAIGS